jgi:hypothetical protein
MPWIFRYFWFFAAAVMVINVVTFRRRLAPAVDRGIASKREVDRFVLFLAAWLIIGPVIFGVIALTAGWSSPFCAGVLEFDTLPKILVSLVTISIWLGVLWWVWRGGGDDFLSRVGPALSQRPSYERRYGPERVRLAATAFILVAAIGAFVMFHVMPQSPEMTCPVATGPA